MRARSVHQTKGDIALSCKRQSTITHGLAPRAFSGAHTSLSHSQLLRDGPWLGLAAVHPCGCASCFSRTPTPPSLPALPVAFSACSTPCKLPVFRSFPPFPAHRNVRKFSKAIALWQGGGERVRTDVRLSFGDRESHTKEGMPWMRSVLMP